ncbi:NEDD4-binding protein 1 [Heptranchias perlo]|uniref:NEDD4-binding protein 1 n=1 Tax=Heptranchias perlo TaxID=212740 RepID=UPI00355AACF8
MSEPGLVWSGRDGDHSSAPQLHHHHHQRPSVPAVAHTNLLDMAGMAASNGHRPKQQLLRPGPPEAGAGASTPRGQAPPLGVGGSRGEISDEFAVASDKQVYLEFHKTSIQELFRVVLAISVPLTMVHYPPVSPGSKQIWVHLKGRQEHVRKAKEYIKGVCNPEFREIEHYPKDMHCIFAGAKGLFLKCLIQDTCADISMASAGVIAITGVTEAVIMAKTRIQQFVQLFRDNQSLPSKRESFIKRNFKHFVESHADKYTMDLLLLPSSVKEELMNLAQDVLRLEEFIDLTLEPDNSQIVNHDAFNSSQKTECSEAKCKDLPSLEEARKQAGTPVSELAQQMDTMLTQVTQKSFGPETEQTSCEESSSTGKERPSCKRRSSSSEDRHTKRQFSGDIDDFVAINSTTKTPCNDLVTSDPIVCNASLIEQQDDQIEEDSTATTPEMEFNMLVEFFRTMGYSSDVIKRVISEMGQTEEPMLLLKRIVEESKRSEKDQAAGVQQTAVSSSSRANLVNETKNPQMEKQGTCTARTAEVKESKPKSKSTSYSQDQRKNETLKENCHPVDVVLVGTAQDNRDEVLRKPPAVRLIQDVEKFQPAKHYNNVEKLVTERISLTESDIVARGSSEQPHLTVTLRQPAVPSNQQVGASVTGVQRFHDLLKSPYKLTLTSDPGQPNLKHIIIDGSNVAMAHGMKKIFSCRGIAIAVEFFWNHGHRKITVFVPQWRTKRDPKITEQHFLTELEELGVLSFTPARTVCGVRIASHDDRFLLHLAEKTGGIIVTNDNLKEFVYETSAWKSIIQDRLLQYTFVGDIFMIPDDPLGRHGPRLDAFLHQVDTCRALPERPNAMLGQNVPLAAPSAIFPFALRQPPIPPLRSKEETEQLKQELLKIFPEFRQRQKIDQILAAQPHMRDPNALSAMVLDQE